MQTCRLSRTIELPKFRKEPKLKPCYETQCQTLPILLFETNGRYFEIEHEKFQFELRKLHYEP